MMARLVRVMVSMRRRKLLPSSAPPAMASSSVSPPAQAKALHDGALHVDQAAGVLRHQQEGAVGQGEAEAGQLGVALASSSGSAASGSGTKSTTPSTGGMPGRLPTTTRRLGACSR